MTIKWELNFFFLLHANIEIHLPMKMYYGVINVAAKYQQSEIKRLEQEQEQEQKAVAEDGEWRQ